MKDTRRNNPQEKLNFIGRQLNEWEQKRELDMANIHDLTERWGAWGASDSCGVDWKPIAAGFKSLIPYGKSQEFDVLMMKVY